MTLNISNRLGTLIEGGSDGIQFFEALHGIGMSEREIRRFLTQSRSMLLLGTTNPDDSPLINPVWYYFDTVKTKLYFYTEPDLKKTKNIRDRNIVYFDVDDEKWPYKGVKGKGRARILTAKNQALAVGKKILTRYVRKGLPLFNYAFEKMKSEEYIIIEITPTYFTSWDFGKLEDQKSLQQSIISS